MFTAITKNVKVSVETFFQENASLPENQHYVFAYRITIENCGDTTVRLMRRHWHIVDSNGVRREVKGEGVVGLQPVIEPGNNHQYVSGCNLQTDLGKMYGIYEMETVADGKLFQVEIPDFTMISPARLN